MSAQPDVTVDTVKTALGAIEIAQLGAGSPVMLIHGSPGGWDSSTAMGRLGNALKD